MSDKLIFGRDVQGYNSFSPPFSEVKYSVDLQPNTDTTVTVPSTSENWIFVLNCAIPTELWVAKNAVASIPTSHTFQPTNSEMNPSTRTVKAGDVIHVISAVEVNVGVLFYSTF